jgi:hypothetical protein
VGRLRDDRVLRTVAVGIVKAGYSATDTADRILDAVDRHLARTAPPAVPPTPICMQEGCVIPPPHAPHVAAPPAVPPNHPEIPDSSRAVAVPGEPRLVTCPRCGGWGWLGDNDTAPRGCSACGGTGRPADPTGAEPGTGKPGGGA